MWDPPQRCTFFAEYRTLELSGHSPDTQIQYLLTSVEGFRDPATGETVRIDTGKQLIVEVWMAGSYGVV